MTPLSEDCGLIEWVSHTAGLREALNALYAAEGLFHPSESTKQIKVAWEKHIATYKVATPAFLDVSPAACLLTWCRGPQECCQHTNFWVRSIRTSCL